MMRTTGTDGKNDQKQCPTGELLCEYEETDESLCVQKGMDIDGEFCPGICPPKCSFDQFLLENPLDNKGCKVPPTCV